MTPQRLAVISRSPRQSRQKQRGPSSSAASALTARRAPTAGRSSTCRAAAMLVGCSCDDAANAFTVASSRITKSSTLSEEIAGPRRPCAGSPDRYRSRPGTGPAARGRRQRRTAPESQRFQPLRWGGEQAFSTTRVCLSVNLSVSILKPSCPSLAERVQASWKPLRGKSALRFNGLERI